MSRPLVGSVNVESPEDIDYKRTVQKQPPPQFSVEILPPTKHGSSHLFGLRISAIGGLSSPRSSRASSYSSEYDVWRRWEDWLWLQEELEEHYDRLAREKRQRLLAGKGIKKDGFYKQDAASSWDSLPPGPDPNSVAQHFHDLRPYSRMTSPPHSDLRGDRLVTDFFGVWREIWICSARQRRNASVIRARCSFATHFDPDIYFQQCFLHCRQSIALEAAEILVFVDAGSYQRQTIQGQPRLHHVQLCRLPSWASASLKLDIPIIVTTTARDSTSSHRSLPSVIDDKPTPFGFNPHVSPSGLSALPEDEEISGKSNNFLGAPLERRTRGPVTSRRARRSGQIIAFNPELLNGMQALDLERNNRESWQSHVSGASAYADLGFALPATQPRSSRLSVSSVATYMSDSSVDAVLPREIPRAQALSEADVEGLDDYYFRPRHLKVAVLDVPRPDSAMSGSSGEFRPRGALGHYRPTSGMSLDSADFVMSSDRDETRLRTADMKRTTRSTSQ
ncbi:hypothetical protein CPB85DRAFT_1453042 [Mucidula mucida]|nr:hypothetical protein CPB85DRAFT_1453042 [Mucidula mucida]